MKAACATKRFIWLLAYALMAPKNRLVCGLNRPKGPKFWLRVMNDLKARGVNDILIATVDGLKGFPEAIGAVFPLTQVQTCIVHLIRHSMSIAPWKDRKPITAALKDIYGPRMPKQQGIIWLPLMPVHGVKNIRRLPKAGSAIGARFSPPLHSLSLCGGLFTPLTDEASLRGLPSKA